jgi:hypothetical protein
MEKCTKWTQDVPTGQKISQMSVNILNGHKVYLCFTIYGPPKYTQIWTFGLKINHLATLLPLVTLVLRFLVESSINEQQNVDRKRFVSSSALGLQPMTCCSWGRDKNVLEGVPKICTHGSPLRHTTGSRVHPEMCVV